MNYQDKLKYFKPSHGYFVGIDSDGCVFDTMEVKQKEFFIPNALKYFDLFAISKLLRETWEFVNLYSAHRGANRFISLIKVFDLLAERNEIIKTGYTLPDMSTLKKWVSVETRLGNATLRKYCDEKKDKSLEAVLRWSEAVNREIGEWLHEMPSFYNGRKSIERISTFADIIVVSQTPVEALEREWLENDLKKYVMLIAGQEHGTKAEHIALAARDKYPDDKILMIGDALGDMNAAQSNGVLFYPIVPQREDESWEKLLNEGLDKFISGKFKGRFETTLLKEFRKSLPEIPPWKSR